MRRLTIPHRLRHALVLVLAAAALLPAMAALLAAGMGAAAPGALGLTVSPQCIADAAHQQAPERPFDGPVLAALGPIVAPVCSGTPAALPADGVAASEDETRTGRRPLRL